MKIELVPNWKELWKAYTVWIAGLGLLPPLALYLLSDWTLVSSLISPIPAKWAVPFYTVLMVLILVLRPIKQDNLGTPTDTQELVLKLDTSAIKDLVDQALAAIKAGQEDGDIPTISLYGSGKQPSMVYMNGELVQLGEAVSLAYHRSGLTAAAWNDLPEASRDALIAEVIDAPKFTVSNNVVIEGGVLKADSAQVIGALKASLAGRVASQ